jgi:uncharacterized membrane protein (UPF0127 family)
MAPIAFRLRRLPVVEILGLEVHVAIGPFARLRGLSHLDLKQAGAGLLIPRCSSVHTFGMRFPLDLIFLDCEGRPLSSMSAVPPRRFAGDRRSSAVLELPSAELDRMLTAESRALRPSTRRRGASSWWLWP